MRYLALLVIVASLPAAHGLGVKLTDRIAYGWLFVAAVATILCLGPRA